MQIRLSSASVPEGEKALYRLKIDSGEYTGVLSWLISKAYAPRDSNQIHDVVHFTLEKSKRKYVVYRRGVVMFL